MAGHKFEDLTAEHLKLDKAVFRGFDKQARDIFCRDYMLHLLREHKNANRVSQAIDLTNKAVYGVMARYGVGEAKRQYQATKRALRKGVKQ